MKTNSEKEITDSEKVATAAIGIKDQLLDRHNKFAAACSTEKTEKEPKVQEAKELKNKV